MAPELGLWHSEWDTGILAWPSGSRGATRQLSVVIHPPVSTAVNDTKRHYSTDYCYFFLCRTFQIHSFWEAKLVHFTVSFLQVIVWLEWKNGFFFPITKIREGDFSSQKSHNSDSPGADKELKISCKCGFSGNSPTDPEGENPVISAFASRGRDILGGKNKVGSIARGLPLVHLHYPVSSADFLDTHTSDEMDPPEEVAESPGPNIWPGLFWGP